MRRHLLKPSQQCLSELGNVLLRFYGRLFVSFCKYEQKRQSLFTKPATEIQIDFLRLKPAVYQNEDTLEVLPAREVFPDKPLPLGTVLFGGLRIAIPRKVDQIPFIVDDKVVDKLGLTGTLRCLRQSFFIDH